MFHSSHRKFYATTNLNISKCLDFQRSVTSPCHVGLSKTEVMSYELKGVNFSVVKLISMNNDCAVLVLSHRMILILGDHPDTTRCNFQHI